MADTHDTHYQGRGFWGYANIFLALAFGLFATLSGAALIYGGLTRSTKSGAPPPPPVIPRAAASDSAAAPGTSAAPGTATVAASSSGDTVSVTIKPSAANPMAYDITTIHAKAGQKVRITFQNESALAPLQHSLIVCKPGSKERMFAAADAMMTDMPKWLARGFIPETPDVLHHTRLLNPGETETIEFTAGPEKGDYPYVCTFPGHARIMNGTLKVE